jgi:ABC-type transport system involved in Fe-S cluster assembly fused permease/ATPase subunit
MQNMLELLEQQPSVCDAPGAGQLALGRGDVAFDNVTFR